jgi:hypothetical protein
VVLCYSKVHPEVLVSISGNLGDDLYTILVAMVLFMSIVLYLILSLGSRHGSISSFGYINLDTTKSHCNIINWMVRWNKWMYEFSI